MEKQANGIYKVTYTYVNPSGSGPFKGATFKQLQEPMKKGDQFWAPFGLAEVKSCRLKKMP